MQNAIQEFTIGFFDSSGVFSIYAKQRDLGRVVKFHLYDPGSSEDYKELLSDDDLIITVRVRLPSGTNLPDIEVDKSAIDLEELSITIPLTFEMLQQYGTAECDLVFASLKESHILSTVHFKLIIVESFNYPQDVTKEYFETWTELYIALRALEEQIQHNEDLRVEAENTRVSNENIREANEEERKEAETAREEAEDARKEAETAREEAEDARKEAETAREEAEDARKEAEAIRERKVQEQVDEAHMWADGKTSETDPDDKPSATNNAKYWAEQAAKANDTVFIDAKEVWESLSSEDKKKHTTVILTDEKTINRYDEETETLSPVIDTFTGATEDTPGTKGLVPPSDVGDKDKYLKCDGTWASIILPANNWRTGLRFKNLGNSFTLEQQKALADGDFSDFWNGDYWEINRKKYCIVDNSNFQKNRAGFYKNSLVIMPTNDMLLGKTGSVTKGWLDNKSGNGYASCLYRTRTDDCGKAKCLETFQNVFGTDHIAVHSEIDSNRSDDTGVIATIPFPADVELPSMNNILGINYQDFIYDSSNRGQYLTQWGQFMLFKLAPINSIELFDHMDMIYFRDITRKQWYFSLQNRSYLSTSDPTVVTDGQYPYVILV